MKRTIMFIMLVLPMCINAQKYVPFPTENVQWNMFFASSLYGSTTDTVILKYSLQGDTIINNIQYKKLCRNIGSDNQPIYRGIGGLREQEKRIYYVGENAIQFYNHEDLLYDFSKLIGDTVWVDDWRPEKEYRKINYVISKIDSIKIGNEYRKRFNNRFVEGIGDVVEGLLGIITPIPTCLYCRYEWHFICFSQNDETLYKDPDFSDCNSARKSVVDGLKNPVTDLRLTVSPNPLLATSVIKWDECGKNPPSTLIISDVIGKTIKTINVSGKTEIDIKRSDFAKGIYICKLATGTVSQSIVKIIVQ